MKVYNFLFVAICVCLLIETTNQMSKEEEEELYRVFQNADPKATKLFQKGFTIFQGLMPDKPGSSDPSDPTIKPTDLYKVQKWFKKAFEIDNSLTLAARFCITAEWRIEELKNKGQLKARKYKPLEGEIAEEVKKGMVEEYMKMQQDMEENMEDEL